MNRSMNVVLVEPNGLHSDDIVCAMKEAGHNVMATVRTRHEADNLIPLLLYLKADVAIICGDLTPGSIPGNDGWELAVAMVGEGFEVQIIDYSAEPYGYADASNFVERDTDGCIAKLCSIVTALSKEAAKI